MKIKVRLETSQYALQCTLLCHKRTVHAPQCTMCNHDVPHPKLLSDGLLKPGLELALVAVVAPSTSSWPQAGE